jgi:small multidrug resistance family-3 protein
VALTATWRDRHRHAYIRSSIDTPLPATPEREIAMARIAQSIVLFLVAGLCEIGGGYLVWLWLRNGRGALLGVLGGIVLFAYGVLPTLQPAEADFGRVYAAYGGVFVVLSLLWGWIVDGHRPDGASVLGAALCLAGVAVIIYWPRPR